MTEYRIARRRMVSEQLRSEGIDNRSVLAAMREVPRHLFVPRLLRHRAYQPCALPIGYNQTISQPFTVGLMTALLELGGEEHVLEIGTGSGYQAAVLARLAGTVVSVERVEPLARRAAATLQKLEIENVTVVATDGSRGYPSEAPYDAILVTACAERLPDRLLGQLADGGKVLIPIRNHDDQVLYRYRKQGHNVLIERSVACRFVPLQTGCIQKAQNA